MKILQKNAATIRTLSLALLFFAMEVCILQGLTAKNPSLFFASMGFTLVISGVDEFLPQLISQKFSLDCSNLISSLTTTLGFWCQFFGATALVLTLSTTWNIFWIFIGVWAIFLGFYLQIDMRFPHKNQMHI